MKLEELSFDGKKMNALVDTNGSFFLNDEDVASGFNIGINEFQKLIDTNSSKFQEGKEYNSIDGIRYWSKMGIVKLGFFNDSDKSLNFIEQLENVNLEKEEKLDKEYKSLVSKDNLVNIYKNLEGKFVEFSKKIEEDENVDVDELKKYIDTFNLFVKTRAEILPNESIPVPTALLNKPQGKKSGLFKQLYKLAAKTGNDAFDFASDTRNQAFEFGTQTERDAFNFTQDTRDAAHSFALKTEDDAFKFATKMEDDAYKFVAKMADDAYHFASDGMNYGYMFASQGEELGPMADRVLWMASEIGIMADRIGEMSDRIVHTEHLIINMSVMILNFGLLIDGTIKTIAEAGLNAIGMVFDKENIPQLQSSLKHLELIGKNVEIILQQQHEYDLKVLENQKELRKITISALDKISLEY